AAAERARQQHAAPSPATSAVVAIDPSTGAVRSLVSAEGPESRFDLVTQGQRQPGSAFKVVVLAAALEQGYVLDDRIDGGGPCTFANPGGAPDPYVVGGSGGWATLTTQTVRSSNCAFLRLGEVVGGDDVVAVARRLGVTAPLDADAISMPLGTYEVRPLEMASIAATIAAGGVRRAPYLVEEVLRRDGSTVLAHRPGGRRVLD
ncbi:hypothetical protein B7486_73205, partial [cyanobacterium TDX16]